MAQLKYTVSVANGSQTVTIPGVNVAAYIKAGAIFMVIPDQVPYFLATDAVFGGVNTTFTLTGTYQGSTNTSAAGVLSTGSTTGGIPTLAQGDVGTATVFTAAMHKVQALIDAVPATALAGQTSDALPEGAINKYFSDAKVRLATLLGFTASNAVVAPTDTVVTGIGKLQGQHSAHVGSRGDVHAVVTNTENGFMSASDKLKLDKVAAPTISATAPPSPIDGQRWINTTNGITYTWIAGSSAWVQVL